MDQVNVINVLVIFGKILTVNGWTVDQVKVVKFLVLFGKKLLTEIGITGNQEYFGKI